MKKSFVYVFAGMVGAVVATIGVKGKMQEKIDIERDFSKKHLELFLLMNQWVKLKQEGKNLASYFENHGYYKIAIYGMSYVGETLAEELDGTTIKIEYGIDQKVDSIYAEFDILSPESKLKNVDVIVVTAIKFFDDIKEKLKQKVSCPIISLEDILYEM